MKTGTRALGPKNNACEAAFHAAGRRVRRVARPIDVEGVRWYCPVVVRGCEFEVADDLQAAGFRTYAPHAVRVVTVRLAGDRRKRVERDVAVLAPYVLVGEPAGLVLSKASHSKIRDFLRDGGQGYARVSARAVAALNTLHLEGFWDEKRKRWPRFRRGENVRFKDGPLEGLSAVVDELPDALRAVVVVGSARFRVPVSTDALERV